MRGKQGGQYKNNKRFQKRNNKGNDPKGTTTNGKKELKFAPVNQNANFATYATVKDAYLRHIQKQPYKSKAILVKAIESETEPDFSTMKPKRTLVTWNTERNEFREETAEEMQSRLLVERLSRQQQQEESPDDASTVAGRVAAARRGDEEQKEEESKEEVPPPEVQDPQTDPILEQSRKLIQEGHDAEWHQGLKHWTEMQTNYASDVLGAYAIVDPAIHGRAGL